MIEILENRWLIMWVAIVLLVVLPSLAHYWWQARKAEIEAGLKRDMIQRGMSAEEIERVIRTRRRA